MNVGWQLLKYRTGMGTLISVFHCARKNEYRAEADVWRAGGHRRCDDTRAAQHRGRLSASRRQRGNDAAPADFDLHRRLRRIPLIRGVIAMAETLTLGMRALSYSANVAAEAEGEEISKGSMAGMMLVSLSLAIGIFFLIPVFASDWLEELIGSALLANIAEGIIRLLLFLGYILLISRMEDIRRVFMYHGAEHMTVHAQEHGDPLEVEHIRKYPTAHPRCGTAFLLVVMVVAILAFIFVGA